ncbi:MAG: hypothetical protein AABX12_01110 [Nanoarchaeota archaeon]
MVRNILKVMLDEITPSAQEINEVSKVVKEFLKDLRAMLLRARGDAVLFIGGSFAKNTALKKTPYEVDIFIRFREARGIAERMNLLIREIKKNKNYSLTVMHGSRDYLQISMRGHSDIVIELIPVLMIRKPQQAQNITDLSAFHVAYMLKKLRGLEPHVRLAKAFCAAQGVYGAESYIGGFSGYALECLIVKYKSFPGMLRALARAETPIVIDVEKHYKNAQEARLLMNESKVKGPIVLVDPTYKERNALAALSGESFARFQKAARAFLARPSRAFFVAEHVNPVALKKIAVKQNAEFVHARIETDRQEGDIAGTKLKKFHYALEHEIAKEFELIKHYFVYSGARHADVYLLVRPKKEIVVRGPPVALKKHVLAFKKMHKKVFEKNGRWYARAVPERSGSAFCTAFAKNDMVKQMGIARLEIKL